MPTRGADLLLVRVEGPAAAGAADHAFDRSPVRVGRDPHNDLLLDDPFASAWHATIEFDGEEIRFTDLGSTNGSSVQGRRVAQNRPVAVPSDGVIEIGALRLHLRLRAAPRPASWLDGDGSAAGDGEPPDERTTDLDSDAAPPPPGRITGLLAQVVRRDPDADDGSWASMLHPGAVIGRFELVRELGRGSFGVVYVARDRQLGRLVAFKAVRPGRHSRVGFRQQALQMEARAVASLTHPNIVSLFDVGTCAAGPYLILELLRGETLHERMARERMPLPAVLDVAIQIARGLEHAHAEGVVHRDLKPSNVFLCTAGLVKVLDFGLSDVFGGGDLRRLGTPAYMAPEQWKGERQDARTDVFAAAVMLCEMTTGQLPFQVSVDGSTALEAGATARVDGGEMPSSLVALITSAVDPDPARRPAHGKAWLDQLLGVQAEVVDRARS